MADETTDDAHPPLSITFWGVRGSIPAPGPHTVRYGGETTCLEICVNGRSVLVDCGSGARRAGISLAERGVDDLDVLFTHTHMDHICGLPFFRSAYDPNVSVRLWGSQAPIAPQFEEIIERLMSPPLFPVATSALKNTEFKAFSSGDALHLPSGVQVKTTALNHPGRATGYRFEQGDDVIVVVTDHEHGDPTIDAGVEEFVTGASLMIYDAMYFDHEYLKCVGWGHSTHGKAKELAEKAGVGHTVLFHHDPWRSDDEFDALAQELKQQGSLLSVAREGEMLWLEDGAVRRRHLLVDA